MPTTAGISTEADRRQLRTHEVVREESILRSQSACGGSHVYVAGWR